MKPYRSIPSWLVGISFLTFSATLPGADTQPDPRWRIHDTQRPVPPVIDAGTPSTPDQPGRPPSDATVLFDGKDLSAWCALDGSPTRWVLKEGAMECVAGSGYVRTLQAFGDCQLHVEWAAPAKPEGTSQGRGNSGLFLMGKYEVQVLDSYQNKTYADGQAAAVYGQYPPLVNACRPPGQWQSYDIVFTRPRFDDQGRVSSPARVTVIQNGVLVQNNVALTGPSGWQERAPYVAHDDKLPLQLQDHGNPVRFRNLWVRELESGPKEFAYARQTLERFVGRYQVDPGLEILIERQEDLLFARLRFGESQRLMPLHAESPTRFNVRHVDATTTFQTNSQGQVTGLIYTIGGDDRKATRIP
jgi:hypothetical protein